jgi:putative ABC transport system permease protein
MGSATGVPWKRPARRLCRCGRRGTFLYAAPFVTEGLGFGHATAASKRRRITIVGVVANTSLYGLENPGRLEIYLPFRQDSNIHMNLVVRSRIEPAAMTSAICGAIASIDKNQPSFAITTMKELVGNSVSTSRITLILLALLGALALVLASIGISGVISCWSRSVLTKSAFAWPWGADRAGVLRMILSHGARIAGAGVIIGVASSLGLTRLMGKLLFSMSAADPPTFLSVAIALLLVVMLACNIPARRKLRGDPMVALRHE